MQKRTQLVVSHSDVRDVKRKKYTAYSRDEQPLRCFLWPFNFMDATNLSENTDLIRSSLYCLLLV